MSLKLYEEEYIQDTADAIREKTGSTEPMTVAQMAAKVRSITGSGTGESVAVSGKKLIGEITLDNTNLVTTETVPNTYVFTEGVRTYLAGVFETLNKDFDMVTVEMILGFDTFTFPASVISDVGVTVSMPISPGVISGCTITNYQITADSELGAIFDLAAGGAETITLKFYTITAGGGGGSSSQPDWNQNDSTAADYIKNRPFYKESVTLFEGDVETSVTSDGLIQNETDVPGMVLSTDPSVKYEIIFNDETYVCTPYSQDFPIIGNIRVMVEQMAAAEGMTVDDFILAFSAFMPPDVIELYKSDTGEPFAIMCDASSSIIDTREAGVHHLTINEVTYKTLDPNFIDQSALLPTVTSANDGQMLGVVNGKWTNMNAPSSLPEVTADDNDKVLVVVNGVWTAASIANGDEVAY